MTAITPEDPDAFLPPPAPRDDRAELTALVREPICPACQRTEVHAVGCPEVRPVT